MISYHPGSKTAPIGTHFTGGFRTVDTNDPTRIARGITMFAWSPSVFTDGYRSKANFLFADWLALDFEDPDFSLGDAVKSFCDMTHVIGTTRNHRVEKNGEIIDRFRVLLPLDQRAHTRRDFEWTLRQMRRRYPIDGACVDGARHFFPCRKIVSIVLDGYSEELITAPPEPTPEERAARIARQAAAGVIPPWMRHTLLHGVSAGRRSNTCYELGCRFAELGFPLGEALSRTLASPLAAIGAERLSSSVTNGFRRAKADMEALDEAGGSYQSGEEER